MTLLSEALSTSGDVVTVDGKKFPAYQSAKMFALIYLRFGQDWTVTCEAIGRLLQSSHRR
jgi:hypothetical protein